MKTIGKFLLAASFAIGMPACEQADDGQSFRGAKGNAHPGTQNRDPDTLIHTPPAADDDDDCLIWDIKNDTDVDDADGNHVFDLTDDGIYHDGVLTCTIEDGVLTENDPTRSDLDIRDGDSGDILLRLKGNALYAPDNADSPVMSYQAFNILNGPVSDHDRLAVSDANLSKATPYRKAVIGALVQGLCGSEGL